MSQQGLRQASWRAIGGTAGTLNGDAMAAMSTELTAHSVAVPSTFNARMIAWLQLRLSSSATNINDILAEWAATEGADKASSIGTFAATPGP